METGRLSSLIASSKKVSRETIGNYVGASNVGSDCLRQIWYQYHCPQKAINHKSNPSGLDVHATLKEATLKMLQKSGIHLILPSVENHFLLFFDKDLPYFKGHPSALWDKEDAVIYIKVTNDSGFKKFKDGGLEKWNPKYYAQVQAYMGMSERPKSYVLCVNKDNSNIHDQTILFEPEYYSQLKMRALFVGETDKPPQRINQSPFYITCKSCKFRNECHK